MKRRPAQAVDTPRGVSPIEPTSANRYYTLAEANAMLPALTEVLRRLQVLGRQQGMVQGRIDEVATTVKSNGHHNPIEDAMVTQAGRALGEGLREGIQQLVDWGIELKELETGLVDFPARREGREVYLCWRLGESEVGYWHEMDTGFAGRMPVDELTV
jgi:hypothetical protein